MTDKSCFSAVLLAALLILLLDVSPVEAQGPFKFPPKIKYNVFANDQAIGNAALFYTKDTGVERFQKELSSLRLTIFQESEDDFQYMYESYVFADEYTLYSDSLIKAGNVKSTLLEMNRCTNNSHSSYKSKTEWGSREYQVSNQTKTISRISALLVASEHISKGYYRHKETFNYFPQGRPEALEMIHTSRDTAFVNGKEIPVHVISLVETSSSEEIHRFEMHIDAKGYIYPVTIIFNSSTRHPLRMAAERLPVITTPGQMEEWRALFLDFMNADTQSTTNRNQMERLILEAVSKELQKKLKKNGQYRNKQLVTGGSDRSRFNSNRHVRKVLDITFDTFIPKQYRKDKIFNGLAVPADIDIIVTGQYINNPENPWIMIRPVMAFRDNQTILTQNLLFKKDEIICRDPGTGRQILCRDAADYIAYKIKKNFNLGSGRRTGKKGVTIENVYRMIIKYGFYCNSVDFGYHAEILERLRNNENITDLASVRRSSSSPNLGYNYTGYSYTFKNGRDVTRLRASGKNYVIKTLSVKKNNFSDFIKLYWAPLKGTSKTYTEARRMIRHMNLIKYEGFSDWRLPSVAELFSISGHYRPGSNFIPFAPADRSVKIWTSTPLDEHEKQRHFHCPNDAFLTVDCSHENNKSRLHFGALCKNREAFVLPVRSAGPSLGPFPGTVNKQRQLFIGNLAFMKSSDRSPIATGELGQLIDRAVTEGIKMATAAKTVLKVDEQNRRMISTTANANDLTNIFFDPNLTKEEKILRIVTDMMEPNHLDLLVTGLFIDDGKNRDIGIRPMVIYRHNKEIRTRNLQFGKTQLASREVAEKIAKEVKQLLEQS